MRLFKDFDADGVKMGRLWLFGYCDSVLTIRLIDLYYNPMPSSAVPQSIE